MDIREFEEFVPSVLERMRADGYARTTMGTAKWVLGWFADYCHEVEVGDVDEAAVADFCAKRFGFAAGESKLLPTQAAIRKRIADRGFYSEANMRLFSANGNSYIMPVPSSRRAFGDAMAEVWAKGFSRDFQWRGGRKHSRIQWRQTRPEGGDRVIVFRDVEENERCRSNYQRCSTLGGPATPPRGSRRRRRCSGCTSSGPRPSSGPPRCSRRTQAQVGHRDPLPVRRERGRVREPEGRGLLQGAGHGLRDARVRQDPRARHGRREVARRLDDVGARRAAHGSQAQARQEGRLVGPRQLEEEGPRDAQEARLRAGTQA